MAKRMLILLLALMLVMSASPVTATVADEKPITIWAYMDEYRRLLCYENGDDLLFSAEDLAWLSNMEVHKSGNRITFTRGAKVVTVYIRDPESIPDDVADVIGYQEAVGSMGRDSGMTLISPCKNIDGVWYISGASVLPWLNVRYNIDQDVLWIQPTGGSVWDIIDTIDMEEYSFDFVECCEEIGIVSKDVQSAAYIKNNGLKMLLDLDLTGNGTTIRSTERYLDLFDDWFKDQSVSDVAIEQIRTQVDQLGKLIDTAGVYMMYAAPEFRFVTETLGEVWYVGETALDYYAYINLFNTDNSQKLGAVNTLRTAALPSTNQNMLDAVDEIHSRYTNYWRGILSKAKYDVIDHISGEMTSEGVLKILDVKWNLEQDLNEQIDRISPYNTIAKTCTDIYEDGFSSYTEEDIADMVNSMMLYLYCIEQSYRTMANYMIQEHEGTSTLIKEYIGKADAAEAVYAQFLNASVYREYDACDYASWNDKSKAILKGFKELSRAPVTEGVGVTVENAMYLAALRDMEISDFSWTVGDLDRDGAKELIAIGAFGASSYKNHCLVIDTNDFSIGSPSFGAAGDGTGLIQSRDGEAIYVSYGYYSAMNQSDGYYGWNGREWDVVASINRHTDVDINGEISTTTSWNISGTSVTQETYQALIDEMDLEGTATFDCPDLEDQFIAGPSGEILEELDNHFRGRDGCVIECFTDVDGDGDQDRVYGVFAAVSELLLYARQKNHINDSWTDFLDLDLTLVVAESADGGVRLRVCRLEEPLDIMISDPDQFGQFVRGEADNLCVLEDGTLTVGDHTFEYQSDGTAFLSPREIGETEDTEVKQVALVEMLGTTPSEIVKLLDAYSDLKYQRDVAKLYGEMDGIGIDIVYDMSYPDKPVMETICISAMGRRMNIDGDLHTAMSLEEIWGGFRPSTVWSQLQPYPIVQGEEHYATQFFYLDRLKGQFYTVTIVFDSNKPSAQIVQLEFVHQISIPDDAMASLGA